MKTGILLLCCSAFALQSTFASELDDYLVEKNILSKDYSIKNQTALSEVLTALSEEDSRVLPVQIDQNTLIEQMKIGPSQLDIQGIITSADFSQFAKSIGKTKTHQVLSNGLLENCALVFEHQFQRVNPYKVNMTLSSDQEVYHIEIKNSQCKF